MTCKDCKIMYRPREAGWYYVELCKKHEAADELRDIVQGFLAMSGPVETYCKGSLADRAMEVLARTEPTP